MSKLQLERAIANLVDLSTGPTDRVQLLPMGRIVPRDGRKPWVLKDKAHAEKVIAASMAWAGGTQLMIDYDHQSIFGAKPDVGGRAPAAAWINRLEVQDDGIWAVVDWTPPAAAALQAREYRYLSPVFDFDKTTGEVTRVINAALTNTPAITALAAVASADLDFNQTGDSSVSKALAAALGLAETATEAEILSALETQKTGLATATASIGKVAVALGLAEDAKADDVAAAATTARASASAQDPDPEKFVPKAGHDEVLARLKVLETDRATAAVDAAIEGGKLSPAMRDWGVSLFQKDQTAWASYLHGAPAILTPGAKPKGQAEPAAPALSDEDRAACAVLGLSEEDFLKTRKEEQV